MKADGFTCRLPDFIAFCTVFRFFDRPVSWAQELRGLGLLPVTIRFGGRTRKMWRIPENLWTKEMKDKWVDFSEGNFALSKDKGEED